MALIQFNTTDSGSIASASTTPLIVDMDVPVTLDNYGVAGAVATVDITCSNLGGALVAIQVEFGDTSGTTNAITEDQIKANLQAEVKKAVADPYHIPEISSAFVPGEYLHPDNQYQINDIKLI